MRVFFGKYASFESKQQKNSSRAIASNSSFLLYIFTIYIYIHNIYIYIYLEYILHNWCVFENGGDDG